MSNWINPASRAPTQPVKNDPALFEPVTVTVLRQFRAGGRTVQPGEVITLARHDALSLRAIGRVSL